MVRRTARRGPNEGSKFCGSPEFPRCHGMVRDQPSVDAPISKDVPASAEESANSEAGGKPRKLLTKIAKTVDKV